MVLKHDFLHRPDEVDTFHDVVSNLGMGTDQGHFLIREPARTIQYFGRHIDLSDVVDHAAEADALNLMLGEAEFDSDGYGKIRGPALVTSRIGIAFLNRKCHRMDSLYQHVVDLAFMLAALDISLYDLADIVTKAEYAAFIGQGIELVYQMHFQRKNSLLGFLRQLDFSLGLGPENRFDRSLQQGNIFG